MRSAKSMALMNLDSGAGYRLPRGGLIDRTRTLTFRFNGKLLAGYRGDTLASALIANGVSLIGRSLKYHRPRGFYGVGLEDPNSMLRVKCAQGFDPAIRAGQVPLAEGLEAQSIRGYPFVGFDLGAVAQLASGLLAAGFYYKTFKWPSWRLFEPIIRRASGFGHLQDGTDHCRTQHRHATCDVLVIGAGPAGLMTAHALRSTGLSILVADDQPMLGGSFLWETGEVDGRSLLAFSRRILADLRSCSAVTLLSSTLVAASYENNMFTLVQTLRDDQGNRGERLWKLKARYVVLATGMIDRPLLFDGNDRPGVMLSSSVRRLIGEFAVAPARRLAIYTNNDSAYLTALNARHVGIEPVTVIDTRSRQNAIHADEARRLGIRCHFESHIEKTFGYRRVTGLLVRERGGKALRIPCDGLASSGGWTPLIHLAAHRGIKPSYDEERSLFVCRDLPAGWFAVGGAAGALDLETVFREAGEVGRSIAAMAGASLIAEADRSLQVRAAKFGTVMPLWIPPCGSPTKIWVDLQNDVRVSDIELAVRENYISLEHLKRYTTLGMGTDQGRTANVNGLAILATLTRRQIPAVGITTFRPPYAAVRMATIANERSGKLYRPRQYLPANTIHRELGAVMVDFGWERPDWYQSNGTERELAVAAEMNAVRQHVGVFDGSSLGKIEVTGPDAAKFLARFYVSNIETLKPGRVRYSVMLREDGVVFDDGVVMCLAENHFLVNSTSGNASTVAAWFERWRQTEWPTMQVAVSPVTMNWASIAIAGPRARDLLRRLEPNFDTSSTTFPHMAVRVGTVGAARARVARISFTGELQYEIAVPARFGAALMQSLVAAEAGLIPRPVGMEAWLRLRLEKGYLHVGSEINGRTTPLDIGMCSEVSKRQGDFIGKRSLGMAFAKSIDREQLVGVVTLDGTLQVGGRILSPGYCRPPCPSEGYITSACHSPTLGRYIGLALLKRGRQRLDETVSVYSGGRIVRCRVCDTRFFDPKGERLHA
jgi:sarcosine oxidase, subunit alpha